MKYGYILALIGLVTSANVIVTNGVSADVTKFVAQGKSASWSETALSGKKSIVVVASGEFSSVFEPSGIVQLSNGNLVVVEDEPERALQLLDIQLDGNQIQLSAEATLRSSGHLFQRLSLGHLDDLEGVTRDQNDLVYAIGSHDDAMSTVRSARQKLIRFSIRDGKMVQIALKKSLRQELLTAYPELSVAIEKNKASRQAGLNIEGLAYDRARNALVIGLRAPLIGGRAALVVLHNPDAYFSDASEPEFATNLWTVDLKKGGIRALEYDAPSDQLLLVSQREVGSKGRFRMWRLSADKASSVVSVNIKGKKLFDKVEGLTPITLPDGTTQGILFVRDDGNQSKQRGGEWFVLTREQLGMGMQKI